MSIGRMNKLQPMAPPRKPEGERVRDITPTAIRLPPDLRESLMREAAVSGRSLTAEIVERLRRSIPEPGQATVVKTGEGPPTVQFTALSGAQRALLMHFSGMQPEKQLALLTLLRR